MRSPRQTTFPTDDAYMRDVRRHLASQGLFMDAEGYFLNAHGERNEDGWRRRPGQRNRMVRRLKERGT